MRLAPSLSLAVSLLLAGRALADDACRPVTAPPLAATDVATDVDPDTANIEVSSNSASVTRSGNAELSGGVELRQGNRTLTAESAKYRSSSGEFDVEGAVEYRDPQLRVKGERGTFITGAGANFSNAEFELPLRPARGSADEMILNVEGDLSLKGVRFSTCPADDEDWVLKASSIDIDQQAQQGIGRNVRLDFLGVPILYAPVVSFPVGDARKSGFLFPTIGSSSNSGFEFGTPYYFNLAPNYDAVVLPEIKSRRGLDLGGNFRYLTGRSTGRIEGNYLPGDRIADRDRYLGRLEHITNFSPRLRLKTQLAHASDSEYFEDFGLGAAGTSIVYLDRYLQLNYLGQRWSFEGRLQNYQTIDRTIDPLSRPYSMLPQLNVSGLWPVGRSGFEAGIDAELVNFDREEGVTGARLDLKPRIAWPLRGPGYFVEPSVAWRATGYALDNVDPGIDDSPSRFAPQAALDAGLIFERTRGKRIQTLEPRALYSYIPYREQSDLPIFDTGLPDLNLIELFRSDRYVGADRLGDANQVALGVTSRLVEADSGRQVLAATLGQVYYFERPRVSVPGERLADANSSDVIAKLSLAAYKHWNVEMGLQYDPHGENARRGEFRVQYRPGEEKVVNLSYRYREGRVEQVDGSFYWPIGDVWRVFARRIYSLQDNTGIESLAGAEYRACCWRARVVARRYVSSRTGEADTSVSLQLELNGLSSVGRSTDAFLTDSLRGYSRAEP